MQKLNPAFVTKKSFLYSLYVDWLIDNFQKIKFVDMFVNCLLTTYVENIYFDELENLKFFYRLFQLLSYINIIESFIDWISNERDRIISFRVSEFLEFISEFFKSFTKFASNSRTFPKWKLSKGLLFFFIWK